MSRSGRSPLAISAAGVLGFSAAIALLAVAAPRGWLAAAPPEEAVSAGAAEGPLVPGGPEPDLIILYTGRVRGFVEPCGCPRNPAGGLARRAGYVDLLRDSYPDARVLLLETGDFTGSADDAGRLKTATYIEGLEDLGYEAVGLGELELAGGIDAWEEALGDSKLDVISASFTMRGSQETYAKPWVVKTYDLGRGREIRIGYLGLSSYNSSFAATAEGRTPVVMRDHVEQARRYLPGLAESTDLVILLANMSPREVGKVLKAAPGLVDLVLASFSDRLSHQELEQIEGVPALWAGDQGRRLGEVRVFLEGNSIRRMSANRIHLTQRYPAVGHYQRMIDRMLVKVNDLMKAAAGRDVPASGRSASISAGAGPAERATYVGSAGCLSCHDAAYRVWEHSRHAHAMRTLVNANQDYNPECVRCHSTGFGTPLGFRSISATPNLANVQCEACHGTGAAHAGDPAAPYGSVSPRTCFACHTRENSPEFSFFKYWDKIRH